MTRIGRWALIFLTMAAWLASGRAQLPGAENSARVVALEPALSVSAARPGETVTAAVVFTVEDGWHINSNQPAQEFLIPTKLEFTPSDGIQAGPPGYPVAKSMTFAFSEEPMSVYDGRNVVMFPVTVPNDAAPGTLKVSGTLSFQPCNDVACFPPAAKEWTLEVPVVAAGADVSPANADLFASAAPAAGAGANRYADALANQGLPAFLVLVFVGGILLNLTPCVYPMIAVTMAIFGARAGETKGKLVGKAMVYVLGMATMYTALGLFAGLTGSLFGGILQSVWVRVGIAAFMAALALGMFGAYTLQAPPALQNALGGTNRTGTIGIYLSGLVVGIFAAPCVGPVVLFLLAMVGERRDPVFGALSFFVLSLGLGAPYILLAASTGMLAKMPRSGAWMEWVKHVFGVILFGVAAWYLALALAPRLVPLVAPVALIVGAVYLGFLDPHGREKKGFRAFKGAVGVVAAALGLYMGAGAVKALNAPESAGAGWPVYSQAAFDEARAAGRPIVLDFSASWCAACRELEHKTFTDAGVKAALEPYAKFKVDLDGANKDQAAELQKRWKVSGLPAIVFLDRDGKEVESSRVGGFQPPKEFLTNIPPAS